MIEGFVKSLGRNALRGHASRREVARNLVELTNFWSLREMESFLEEMSGLSFTSDEDRQLFIQFFESWIGNQQGNGR